MSNLILICGQPACGKSTIANECIRKNPDVVWVSRDKIRFALLNDNEGYFNKENEVYKIFVDTICDNLSKGKDVLVDQTNLTVNARNKLLNAIKNKQVKYDRLYAIWVETSLETSLARNEQRAGRAYVPPEALTNMYNRREVPTKDEGFNDIYIIKGE